MSETPYFTFKVPSEPFSNPIGEPRIALISPELFQPGELLSLDTLQEKPSAFIVVNIGFMSYYCKGKFFSVNK